MNRVLLLILLVGLAFGLQGCTDRGGNSPPSVPSISLASEAEINEEVVVTVRSTDPENNEIAYKVHFGDGVESEWSEYFTSGQEAIFIHKYEATGDYRVKAVASDRKATGEWSQDRWIKIKTSLPPPLEEMRGKIVLLTLNPKPTKAQMEELGFNGLMPYAGTVSGWTGDYISIAKDRPGKVILRFTADEPDSGNQAIWINGGK